jgi:hypothetical protein
MGLNHIARAARLGPACSSSIDAREAAPDCSSAAADRCRRIVDEKLVPSCSAMRRWPRRGRSREHVATPFCVSIETPQVARLGAFA